MVPSHDSQFNLYQHTLHVIELNCEGLVQIVKVLSFLNPSFLLNFAFIFFQPILVWEHYSWVFSLCSNALQIMTAMWKIVGMADLPRRLDGGSMMIKCNRRMSNLSKDWKHDVMGWEWTKTVSLFSFFSFFPFFPQEEM